MARLEIEVENIYDGPMDLLIELIKKNKVDIMDIPINDITLAFIARMKEINYKNIDNYLEFADMAAELLQMKSRLLLPAEEEEEEEDPRLDLVNRIIEYNYYKKMSHLLKNYYRAGSKYLLKKPEDLTLVLDNKDIEYKNLSVDRLSKILTSMMIKFDREESNLDFDIRIESLSVTDGINIIKDKMTYTYKINFRTLIKEDTSKLDIISLFLALLELTKEMSVIIEEDTLGQDIIITRNDNEYKRNY